MTFLDETRFHYFSLDSDQDLSTATLSLSTQDPAVWVVASHTTAPASASSFPAPQVGLNRYWWRALFGPGEQVSLTGNATTVSGHLTNAPEDLYPTWTIYEEDPDPQVPYCWPLDVGCLGTEWNTYTAEVQETASLLAVETLRMLTAYRVGGCPVTIRPCRESCARLGTWQVYPVQYGYGVPILSWQPALYAGQWMNVACGCPANGCSCGPITDLRLPGAPGAVVEVKVDGVVLPPTDWRIDNTNRLTRIGGPEWPTCQDMTLDDDEVGTFAVTYTMGAAPGRLGAVAAGRLAGEYALLCQGRNCALPATVRTVARNGVTLDLAAADGDLWPGGLTGLRDVDVFIRRWNPHALKAPATVWSPDVHPYRRTT